MVIRNTLIGGLERFWIGFQWEKYYDRKLCGFEFKYGKLYDIV